MLGVLDDAWRVSVEVPEQSEYIASLTGSMKGVAEDLRFTQHTLLVYGFPQDRDSEDIRPHSQHSLDTLPGKRVDQVFPCDFAPAGSLDTIQEFHGVDGLYPAPFLDMFGGTTQQLMEDEATGIRVQRVDVLSPA